MIKKWIEQHHSAASRAWRTLGEQWALSGLVIALLAVALSLPSVLWMMKGLFDPFQSMMHRDPVITVFLKPQLPASDEFALKQELLKHEGVRGVQILSPDDILKRLDLESSLSQAGDLPLPRLIEIQMQVADAVSHMKTIERRYAADERVDSVVFDLEWLHEWEAWSQLAHIFFWALTLLLMMMVALIIANNVILKVQENRKELEIMSLIGAYAGYMRRPFLYFGLILGALGGILASILSSVFLWMLKSSVFNLASLYQVPLIFWPHVISTALETWIFAAFFAGLSAFVAVTWQLRRVI